MIVMAAVFLRDQPTFVELLADNQNNGNNLFSLRVDENRLVREGLIIGN